MAIGKYLSLEEARKAKKLERFAAQHPSKGDQALFEAILLGMSKSKKTPKASKKGE